MIRILGIDPGSRTTGFGVIDVEGQRLICAGSGCIQTRGDSLAERLAEIHQGILDVAENYAPQEIAIERVFVQRNADSALKLGQARGAAISAVAGLRLPVHEYSPTQIKQAVVGRGNAAKKQVQHMVCALLNLNRTPPADAADALAMAICHSHLRGAMAQLAAGRGMRRGRLWK
ncbi:MAG TPA: crossover junction endodeoxyribonuclease RuvC [Gammaproteobacteria bacterium]|nr:crossover junction endodeoxyribonuclease RuvC [Gammaproteobacteria bacterium]